MANYLNNKDLYKEIVISLEQDHLTENAERMFIMLVDNVILKFRYKNEDDRFDCKQTAFLDLFANWRNFNPKYLNAFAYYWGYTEITKRGISRSWNELYRQKGNKGNYIPHFSIQSSNDGKGIYNL